MWDSVLFLSISVVLGRSYLISTPILRKDYIIPIVKLDWGYYAWPVYPWIQLPDSSFIIQIKGLITEICLWKINMLLVLDFQFVLLDT